MLLKTTLDAKEYEFFFTASTIIRHNPVPGKLWQPLAVLPPWGGTLLHTGPLNEQGKKHHQSHSILIRALLFFLTYISRDPLFIKYYEGRLSFMVERETFLVKTAANIHKEGPYMSVQEASFMLKGIIHGDSFVFILSL
jgi:hypothetical protein